MHPVENYLRELREIRSTGSGVRETSYYPALSTLLNAVGGDLKPKVRCILTLRDTGAGLPDGGLFTPDQFQRQARHDLIEDQLPSRGAIEAKGTCDDALAVARSPQVLGYIGRYNQVLVTTYRDFVLVRRSAAGQTEVLERFQLESDERAFWSACEHPHTLAGRQGQRLVEYLSRVMRSAAPLTDPADVAWFLASYARDALIRAEQAESRLLQDIREALEEALVMKFGGEKGEHFFRSTLVQTLFYGVFSAWVLFQRAPRAEDRGSKFDWRLATSYLRVPVLRKLFGLVSDPGDIDRIGLAEPLGWAAAALNRVVPADFFARFQGDHAVQYFYEPFLAAFDPDLRKALGVWYTPIEVVRYMVARADTVLRDELGVEDGLADPGVLVLDPCCGTGAYLVEVLRLIEGRLRTRGDDALLGGDLKKAATERIFGFEILPASYVVAHLQLDVYLQSKGVALSGTERAAVYLTNALTGWIEPPQARDRLPYREFEAELAAATKVKRADPILVVIGNPPYNGFAGTNTDETERGLTEVYRSVKGGPRPEGQGLNEMYVRFFRIAERRIVNGTGRGLVCFISGYSWLDGLSFPGMREHYLEVFDRIWIDSLNGDKYKTGKITPDGDPDPSVFSTEMNREGIQVGTAVAMLLRKEDHNPAGEVRFREFWGATKRAALLATANLTGDEGYTVIQPAPTLGRPFRPMAVAAEYLRWPSITDILPTAFPGVKTSRDDFVIDIDRQRLIDRMQRYFDPAVTDTEIARDFAGALDSTARYQAARTRKALCERGFLPKNVVRYAYRPFDVRWLYWEPEGKLLDEKRPEYFAHVDAENIWIESRQKQPTEGFDRGMAVRVLADNGGNGLSSYFPMFLRGGMLPRNLSAPAMAYAAQHGDDGTSVFYHVVAVLNSSAYRRENADALHQNWARLPLPDHTATLLASSAIGRKLADLHDPERKVVNVTSGEVRAELRHIAVITGTTQGASLRPEDGDLDVTAGWGHAGQGGVVMPGRGRAVERPYTSAERGAIEQGATVAGREPAEFFALLGTTTFDLWLNDRARWSNVPARVYGHTMGSYAVLKKWLSYRERALLGRGLLPDEARLFRDIARRIAAILLLGPTLDESYRRAAAAHRFGA